MYALETLNTLARVLSGPGAENERVGFSLERHDLGESVGEECR